MAEKLKAASGMDLVAAMDDATSEAPQSHDDFPVTLRASSAGSQCVRQIWLDYRWASQSIPLDTKSFYATDDGNRTELVVAERIKRIPGVKLRTTRDETGQQYRRDVGMISGGVDGLLTGFPGENPTKEYIWDHKAAGKKRAATLQTILKSTPENGVLFKWDQKYWTQAQIYMRLFHIHHHVMTVSFDGAREMVAFITHYNHTYCLQLIKKLERVAMSNSIPIPISTDPSLWLCKTCKHHEVCFDGRPLRITCRSCKHAEIANDNSFTCGLHNTKRTIAEQKDACESYDGLGINDR